MEKLKQKPLRSTESVKAVAVDVRHVNVTKYCTNYDYK